ncbi:glycosyltransferase family 2 protein [Halapricum hydrolyticum]|uniref:Glycosyltransferase family 2 protein n=1 Tax=Halapricum hydrolyticum TaxID=2979991 RepID=A0AAE3IFS9_9EURY|nr:glycosyltransferase family A protein [Halapricum hydrolyticum]MCU4719623.1 glycosyltransferase family 2 protein [Halapricum hydrolyticum]MCU4728528.1 glycosyltransferase family 2 protein [Halapricum hydrolyticum]
MTKDRSKTLVSVVIPTYERPEYLRGAIQTALGQTYDNIEVIVVDDGSSEFYADEIVAEFPESVTCIRHDENKGLSAARNTGIRNANGEYVAFLDDDDRWHWTKIARQVSTLDENKNAGLATCLVVALTPDNEVVHCETDAPSGDCSESMLIGNQIGTPSRVLVRRECFDDIGTFDESLPTKQDWDFYLRLCQEWDIAAVENYLCFRTVHESMSSSTHSLERDKKKILQKHESLIRNAGVWEQAQASVNEEIGRSYLGDGSLKQAREYLRTSLSDITVRRMILLSLSYTHPAIISSTIGLERTIARYRSNCSEISITSADIPGLQP